MDQDWLGVRSFGLPTASVTSDQVRSYHKDVEESTASRGAGVAPGAASVNLHLFLQWDGGIHSLSQDPTELRAPVFDGLEASSRSAELAPSVPRR